MQGKTVPNYLPQAILVTLFCCLPFGVVAIIYAAQVDTKLSAGDYNGAVQASENAKKWCWLSVASTLVLVVIYIIIFVLTFVLSGSS